MPGWDSSGRKRQLSADERSSRRMFVIFIALWIAVCAFALAMMLGWF